VDFYEPLSRSWAAGRSPRSRATAALPQPFSTVLSEPNSWARTPRLRSPVRPPRRDDERFIRQAEPPVVCDW